MKLLSCLLLLSTALFAADPAVVEKGRAEEKRARNTRKLREALERKRAAPVHHPAYDFNDEAIPYGASYWARLAESLCAHAGVPPGAVSRRHRGATVPAHAEPLSSVAVTPSR